MEHLPVQVFDDLELYRAIARCHQRALPIIDGVGRVLAEGDTVRLRRYRSDHLRVEGISGEIIHLFDFADTHPPEIEFRVLAPVDAEEVVGRIIVSKSHLTGGCWKFETLLSC